MTPEQRLMMTFFSETIAVMDPNVTREAKTIEESWEGMKPSEREDLMRAFDFARTWFRENAP